MKLSLVITVAPEDNLDLFRQVLDSAAFADEIIIYAIDLTRHQLNRFIKSHQIKFVSIPRPAIVELIRDKQVRQTKNDWVLILDADEIITPQLRQEIQQTLSSKSSFQSTAAYALLRHNYSLGFRTKYGGWGDDYQVRLIYKPLFVSWPKVIHTTPRLKGKIAKLKSPIKHYKDPSLSFVINKTNRYSEAEAELFFKGGLPPVNSFTLFRKLTMEIFRRGILKLGILDGPIGIIQSIYQGFSVFITYAKLYEKQLS